MIDTPERLAIFVPAMGGGGAERAMLNLAQGIEGRGFAVDLVLARAEGPYMAEIPSSVRVVDLGASRAIMSLPALVRYLRGENPKVLLSVLHANFIALWARRLAGVRTKVVVSERNTLSRESQHSKDLRVRLAPQLARRFYPWADGIVAVSNGVADDLARTLRISRRHIRVIYNPVVTPELKEKSRAPLSHPWFEKNEPPVLLAVGRLSPQKDFSTLLRAFAQVRRIRPARLMILGEGEQRAELIILARHLGLERDVSLPGFVMNPYPYMVRSSLFILASRWEGLPGALIEAMYCGAPLIATDCASGTREILADGKYGQIVPVGDVDALARAVELSLADRRRGPPPQSWHPFELEVVVTQYIDFLLQN